MFCNYLLNCQILFNVYSTCSCMSILYIILSSPYCLSEHPCTCAFQHFCWLPYETAQVDSHSEFSFHVSALDLVTWLHLSKRVSATSSLASCPALNWGPSRTQAWGYCWKSLDTGPQRWSVVGPQAKTWRIAFACVSFHIYIYLGLFLVSLYYILIHLSYEIISIPMSL